MTTSNEGNHHTDNLNEVDLRRLRRDLAAAVFACSKSAILKLSACSNL